MKTDGLSHIDSSPQLGQLGVYDPYRSMGSRTSSLSPITSLATKALRHKALPLWERGTNRTLDPSGPSLVSLEVDIHGEKSQKCIWPMLRLSSTTTEHSITTSISRTMHNSMDRISCSRHKSMVWRARYRFVHNIMVRLPICFRPPSTIRQQPTQATTLGQVTGHCTRQCPW
jgi:hypothetical protein